MAIRATERSNGEARHDDGLTPYERLLDRCDQRGMRRLGQGRVLVRCPAHDDRNPSLSVRQSDDRVLVHCFAGCDTHDVLQAVGLDWGDAFVDDHDHDQLRQRREREQLKHLRLLVDIGISMWSRGELGGEEHAHDRAQVEVAAGRLALAGEAPPVLPWTVEGEEQDEEPAAPRLWRSASDWTSQIRAPDWLVPGIQERATLSAIVGGWGDGKSLVELDLAIRCTLPAAHHELKVWQGRALPELRWLYVCGEGQRGVQRRIAAWCDYHGVDVPSELYVVDRALRLGGGGEDEDALTEALVQIMAASGDLRVDVVTLDTLARCFDGDDENSSTAMGRFVQTLHAHAIDQPWGAAVRLVHHVGHHDKSRGRGSSALHGALDSEWRIGRDGNQVSMRATKTKDEEPPGDLYWRIVGHSMSDSDGVTFTAPMVLEVSGEGQDGPKPKGRPGRVQVMHDCIARFTARYAMPPTRAELADMLVAEKATASRNSATKMVSYYVEQGEIGENNAGRIFSPAAGDIPF
jgi:hypothetical protein